MMLGWIAKAYLFNSTFEKKHILYLQINLQSFSIFTIEISLYYLNFTEEPVILEIVYREKKRW